MSLSDETKLEIKEVLTARVLEKLDRYQPETNHMPFHYRLLGKDRYAMFSFIQSMNTTFGISIWEQLAVILAKGAGYNANHQYDLLGEIDPETETKINVLYQELRSGNSNPNKNNELTIISNSIQPGEKKKDIDSRVDCFVEITLSDGIMQENYFDITSAKPNMKEFAALKLKLLRWTGLRLSQKKIDESLEVITRLAIPYNPYYPNPYARWTARGLYDLEAGEVLVGEEFWNFVAGDNIYDELLDLFQEVGNSLRDEIDAKFKTFKDV